MATKAAALRILAGVKDSDRAALVPIVMEMSTFATPGDRDEPDFVISYRDATNCYAISLVNCDEVLTGVQLAKFAMDCKNFVNMDIRPSVDYKNALKVTVMVITETTSVRSTHAFLEATDLREKEADTDVDTGFIDEMDVGNNTKLWLRALAINMTKAFAEDQGTLRFACVPRDNQLRLLIDGFFNVSWNRLTEVLLNTKAVDQFTIGLGSPEANNETAMLRVTIVVVNGVTKPAERKRKRDDIDDIEDLNDVKRRTLTIED